MISGIDLVEIRKHLSFFEDKEVFVCPGSNDCNRSNKLAVLIESKLF